MKTIGVTYEITNRYYREFEITDEAFEEFIRTYDLPEAIGEDAYMKLEYDTINSGDDERDYAVVDEDGVTIIDWD